VPDKAHERAKALDESTATSLASLSLPSAREAIAQLRTYLSRREAEIRKGNNVAALLRQATSRNTVTIALGPSFDKGPTDRHFLLKSGARLSFGLTVREANGRSSLVAYRFQLNLPEIHQPSFYRFDLNEKAHAEPLQEPRCHLHPGSDQVRLPCPVLSPLEILDRIFHVIEPSLGVKEG
jgi:hypothetical protein